MKKLTKKEIIIILVAGLMLLGVGVFLLFWFNREKDYRLLKVCEVDGESRVAREDTGTLDPYVNMQLESGDQVTLETGVLNIQADEDKYIFLEEHTELLLEATGNSKNSRTKIRLIKGGITNDIRNPLSEQSTYEVNTPNATMSVRGTVFYVCVYEENGVEYTKVSVFNGSVTTKLIYDDGTESEEEVTVESGKEVLIYQDEKTTDYVTEPRDIEYEDLPESVLRVLDKLSDDNRELSISKEELTKLLEGPFTVTFMYDGKEFGHQIVKKGELAEEPSLAPTADGEWKFDFSKPIDQDTEIQWEAK